MLKPISYRIPLAAMTAAVCSCAAPKAVLVEENAPATAAQEKPKNEEPEPEPVLAGPPDDGIRLPDMLALPGENEFRNARTSGGGRSTGSGAVIARPPSE